MISDDRKEYLDKWITNELINRFSKIVYFDPWNEYDLEYVLRDYEVFCEFLDKQQQDELTRSIRDAFDDFTDLDYIRDQICNKCRHILTTMERQCFIQNMHNFIQWSIEDTQLRRQLTSRLYSNRLPPEMISEIFSYIFPRSRPRVVTVQEYETDLIMKYIDNDDKNALYHFFDY